MLGITDKTSICDSLSDKETNNNMERMVSIMTYITKAQSENAFVQVMQYSGHCTRSNHPTSTYSINTVQLVTDAICQKLLRYLSYDANGGLSNQPIRRTV